MLFESQRAILTQFFCKSDPIFFIERWSTFRMLSSIYALLRRLFCFTQHNYLFCILTAKATTPWIVTPKTTTEPHFGPMSPPPPGVLPPQQSPLSVMSDCSSTSSIMGKTGEWTVTDKQVLTPGPKLPERQHAGWQVSKKTEDNKVDLDAKREPEIKRANGEEDEKRKKKKKHKKDKKKKRDKKEKKYEKLGESDDSETERKKRKKKKDKFGSKERKKTDEQENDEGDKFKSKKHKRKHKAGSDEGDEAVSKKKPCLVSYESSSNSDGEEITNSANGTRKAAGIESKRSSTVSMGRNIVEKVECI